MRGDCFRSRGKAGHRGYVIPVNMRAECNPAYGLPLNGNVPPVILATIGW